MRGPELRAWAWTAVKGQRGAILLALLLSGFPTIVAGFLRRAGLAGPLLFPFTLAGGMLQMGLYRCVLTRVDTHDGRLSELVFNWQRDLFPAALLAALIPALAAVLLGILPGWLYDQGYALSRQAMEEVPEFSAAIGRTYLRVADRALYDRGMALSTAGTLSQLAVAMAADVLFLPLSISVAVGKTGPAGTVVRDSLVLGLRRFGRSFVYLFWVELPLYGGLAAVLALGLLSPLSSSLFALVFLGFSVWYLPYLTAARVLYARELFFPGKCGEDEQPPPPPPRPMRLRSGGGGWYWCPLKSGPRRGGYLERRGMKL